MLLSKVYSSIPMSATIATTRNGTRNFFRMKSSIASSSDVEFFKIGITGASGLLGTAFLDELSINPIVNDKPVKVIQFVRGNAANRTNNYPFPTEQVVWNPQNAYDDANTKEGLPIVEEGKMDVFQTMDALIHLAGENIGTSSFLPHPLSKIGIQAWTPSKKQAILESRTGPTRALAQAISKNDNDNSTFLVASGISIYGHEFIGPDVSTANETYENNDNSFLYKVSKEWEEASNIIVDASNNKQKEKKTRVVNMRLAPVMSQYGGALEKLVPIFKLGGGGRVGSGEQWFSHISARDAARAMLFLLSHQNTNIEGPVNLCAPSPCTNMEFTKALGQALNRPTIIPLPEFMVKLLFGQMGEEILLGGVKAIPQKLIENGFEFKHKSIDQTIQSALEEKI